MEVDRLSKQAQAALRRTMEKYTGSCRLILYCTNPTKVIEPVRSRCLGVRVAAPSDDMITTVLMAVTKKEGLSLPPVLAQRVARASGRNLRRALLMLEATKVITPFLQTCFPIFILFSPSSPLSSFHSSSLSQYSLSHSPSPFSILTLSPSTYSLNRCSSIPSTRPRVCKYRTGSCTSLHSQKKSLWNNLLPSY